MAPAGPIKQIFSEGRGSAQSVFTFFLQRTSFLLGTPDSSWDKVLPTLGNYTPSIFECHPPSSCSPPPDCLFSSILNSFLLHFFPPNDLLK